MNAHAFLQQRPQPTQQEFEDLFGGNLCRCTGYRPILHAVRTLAFDYDAARDQTQKCRIDPSSPVRSRGELARIRLDQLPPPDQARPLHFTGSGREWYRPVTLAEVHRLKKRFVEKAGREQVKLVFGNTAAGVYQQEKPIYLIDISAIPELGRIAEQDAGIFVGAAVPIQQLIDVATEVLGRRPAEQTTGLRQLTRHLTFLAGYQVRCAGSVAGNIFMTRDHAQRGGPFPSDLFTVPATLGSTITIGSTDDASGSRTFPLMQMPAVEALPADAVILSFHIPYTRPREYVQTYRIARRVQMAHPIVNAGFRFRLSEDGRIDAGEATIIYGGLASMIHRAGKTEQAVTGKPWNHETLRAALAVLKQEVRECSSALPEMDEEAISTAYRRQLAESFFYKFFLHVALAVKPEQVASGNVWAANHRDRPLSSGTQEHTEYPELFPLSQPIIKHAAFVQASGEVNRVDYLLGLAKNSRLQAALAAELQQARQQFTQTLQPARIFRDFRYRTLDSWSRERRVVGKAGYLDRGANPRFVVTSLSAEQCAAPPLYEQECCGRGDMENRIKEQQLMLFANRVSCQTMRANQVRLCLATVAYVVLRTLRQFGLGPVEPVGTPEPERPTEPAQAQCSTLRLKLLKIGAVVRVSVRRVWVSLSQAYPWREWFVQVWQRLRGLVVPAVSAASETG